MKPEISLSRIQEPASCPYSEPGQSQSMPLSTFLKIHLNIILPSTPGVRSYQRISPGPRHKYPLRNKASFYGEELLAPRPTPTLEDLPLSSVRDCLFNIFTATLHNGGRSCICKLRTRHAVVTRTYSSHS